MSTAVIGKDIRTAVAEYRCWTCGKALRPGELYVFAVEPGEVKRRISHLPPSHPECVKASAGMVLVYVRSFEVLQDSNGLVFRFSKPIRMR